MHFFRVYSYIIIWIIVQRVLERHRKSVPVTLIVNHSRVIIPSTILPSVYAMCNNIVYCPKYNFIPFAQESRCFSVLPRTFLSCRNDCLPGSNANVVLNFLGVNQGSRYRRLGARIYPAVNSQCQKKITKKKRKKKTRQKVFKQSIGISHITALFIFLGHYFITEIMLQVYFINLHASFNQVVNR